MTFIEARLRSQSVPTSKEVPIVTDENFETGALGFLTNGEFEEAGADPVAGSITHVAQAPGATADVAFGAMAGSKGFPPGRVVTSETFPGGAPPTLYRAEYVGALPANPGGSYGVVRGADNLWRVDFNETVATVVKYEGLVSEPPLDVIDRNVLVSFLPA